jgi:hypothetical protein
MDAGSLELLPRHLGFCARTLGELVILFPFFPPLFVPHTLTTAASFLPEVVSVLDASTEVVFFYNAQLPPSSLRLLDTDIYNDAIPKLRVYIAIVRFDFEPSSSSSLFGLL